MASWYDDPLESMSDAASAAWADAQAGWAAVWSEADDAWHQLYEESKGLWETIQAAPARYSTTVESFVAALHESQLSLAHIAELLPTDGAPENNALWDTYKAMEDRFNTLAAPFYQDAVPTDVQGAAPVGLAPLLILAGVAVGVAAIGWAFVGHEYALSLRDQTALADKELTARVEASKEGRVLQPTTLPEVSDPPLDLSSVGKYVAAGAAVLVALAVVPRFLGR